MKAIVLTLIPSLALLVIGGVFRRRLSVKAWLGVDRLNFELLFPALIFASASSRPIRLADAAVIGTGVWVILTLGLVAGWFLRPWGPTRFLDFAGAWQTAWRFNTAIAFVAVLALPEESAVLMSVAIGFAVPVANIFAVAALSRGHGLGPLAMLKKILLNPFFLASFLGTSIGLLGWQLPDLVLGVFDRLASAAVPIALLAIGATLDWQALWKLDRFTAGMNAIKLLLLPGMTWLMTQILGVPNHQAAVLVVFAALPTASAAHVLASVFGADRALPATLIAQMTLFACLSLPLWIRVALG